MLNADLTEKNRAVATSALRATFGMFMAWAGAFVSLTFILVVVYNLVPEHWDSCLFAIWLLPMLLWALPAMYAGGNFLGLSLAPRQIWKALLLVIVADGLLFAFGMLYYPSQSSSDEFSLGLLAFMLIVAALPSLIIAAFVATNNRRRMRLQFGLTLAGIVVIAGVWLSLSLALPVAMRNSIAEIAGDQPYRLYVPDPKSDHRYRSFAGSPDFWTFHSIFTAKSMHQAHMCLFADAKGSEHPGYHWSFYSGFRFVKNSGAFIAC